jgi:hypothetical protein
MAAAASYSRVSAQAETTPNGRLPTPLLDGDSYAKDEYYK